MVYSLAGGPAKDSHQVAGGEEGTHWWLYRPRRKIALVSISCASVHVMPCVGSEEARMKWTGKS